MTDWKAIAQARGVVWEESLEARQIATLITLESTLSVLVQTLPFELEPAPVFSPLVLPEEP
ncbi:MAG: hypothetical protein NZV14_10330 [Bryobacteraceae bacterium]|nr:hypothetical protein [Bryobacteraceae bacterium]MDW8378549.1 hypothetical protein [Bryobacterales bacterium]